MREERHGLSSGLLPWVLQPVLGAWIAATALKETPLFWRNAGGYPLSLRLALLEAYYPFTALLLGVCAIGFLRWLRAPQRSRRRSSFGWLVVALALGAGIAWGVANNVTNLIEGRPLHFHRSP